MTGPMMRARLHGNPCRVPGHGSHCDRVDYREPVNRAQDRQRWRRDAWELLAVVDAPAEDGETK